MAHTPDAPLSQLAVGGNPPEMLEALQAMLEELHIIGSGPPSREEEEAYAAMLAQRARVGSLHHAILEIMDCLLCKPLTVRFTEEYIDVWDGTWEVRRVAVHADRWARIQEHVRSLAAVGAMRTQLSRWQPGVRVHVFPPGAAAGHASDTALIGHIPWRMNALRVFLGALLHIGYKCEQLQVEIAQAVQVGARQTAARVAIDRTAAQMFPVDAHRECLRQALPMASSAMACAWQPAAPTYTE